MTLAFPLTPSFFGLGPSYKPILHDEIFTLIYHSHGGFNWADIYSMPIWLRKFYIKKLIETREAEKKAANPNAKENASKRLASPPIVNKK